MRQKRAKQNRKISTLVFSANEKMGHKNECNSLAFDFPVKSLFWIILTNKEAMYNSNINKETSLLFYKYKLLHKNLHDL